MERSQDEPVFVGLWRGGREIERFRGTGKSLKAAVEDIAEQIRQAPLSVRASPRTTRLRIDIVSGRGPLVDLHPLIAAVALHPGVDGLGAVVDGHEEAFLLPDDLIMGNMLQAGAPIKHVDFKLGVNYRRALSLVARRLEIQRKVADANHRSWFRFRSLSLVETRDQRGLVPLVRGTPPKPELTSKALREAAIDGGRYLVSHLAPNGRYQYQVDLVTGRATNPNRPGPYSIPRHAGTTYFLAELYRHTGEVFLREPIERAFRHLQELIEAGGCTGKVPGSGAEFACVVDRGQRSTELGSTALTVVALAEYQRATGKKTYLPLARKLAEFLLWMQREDGSFTHVYRVREQTRDEQAYLLYYTGEAALALARMHEITGEQRYIDAAERALDHLVDWYDFFLGGFFYGEEHWTCIAAEAAHPAIEKQEYWDFCRGYGRFLRAQQLESGDFPGQEDLVGSYVFTPFAMPQNTPTGSRTESMISAYQLGAAMGDPDPALLEQIRAAMAFSLGQQIRPEYDWFVSRKSRGKGAIPTTPADRIVRIDYVQHVCSAMLRASELVGDP